MRGASGYMQFNRMHYFMGESARCKMKDLLRKRLWFKWQRKILWLKWLSSLQFGFKSLIAKTSANTATKGSEKFLGRRYSMLSQSHKNISSIMQSLFLKWK